MFLIKHRDYCIDSCETDPPKGCPSHRAIFLGEVVVGCEMHSGLCSDKICCWCICPFGGLSIE